VTSVDVPFFNAPIYLENKQQIGKVDEIFGTLKDFFISVKLSDDMKATSFKEKDPVNDLFMFSTFFCCKCRIFNDIIIINRSCCRFTSTRLNFFQSQGFYQEMKNVEEEEDVVEVYNFNKCY